MKWAKASILAAFLALPASFGAAVAADQTTDAKPADAKPTEAKPSETKPSETKPAVATKASDTKSSDTKAPDASGKPSLSKSETRKLDAKCSDEADAKHLHGEPRKAFRSACKSKGGLNPV